MNFARMTYRLAGIYGLLVLLPGFFLERQFSASTPPELTHPEFYYGFYGSALVWQFVFLVIASDPGRYHPLILVSILEKAAFFVACLALWATGRMGLTGPFYGSLIDGFWMVAFAICWLRTRPDPTRQDRMDS